MRLCGEALRYLSSLKVEDDTREIAVEQLLCIAADGNYLRVHTVDQSYEIRETLSRLAAKLDPARFVRVHRSFVVNLAHVLNCAANESCVELVTLSNGMEVPVGPNYRSEFANILGTRTPLSALRAMRLRGASFTTQLVFDKPALPKFIDT